jgi:O-antigen/teichoic acid export membrane protein
VGQVSRAGLRAFRDVRVAEAMEQVVLPGTTALAVIGLYLRMGRSPLLGVGAAAIGSGAVGLASWLLLLPRFRSALAGARYAPRTWMAFSLPLGVEAALLLLVGRAGYLFLAHLATSETVGVYASAVSLAGLVGLPLAGVNAIFGPTIASLHARREHARLQVLYARITWSLLFLGAAGVALIGLASTPLLAAFGRRFVAEGRGVLFVLLLWQLVNVATGPTGPVLVMTGRLGWKLANAVVTLVLTLALAWWLVPSQGAVGAALALTVSTAVVNVAQVVQVRRLLGLWAYDRAGLPHPRAWPGPRRTRPALAPPPSGGGRERSPSEAGARQAAR